jgi:hypothetical protein
MRQGQNRRPRGRNPNNTGGGGSGSNNNRRGTNQLTRSFESNGPDVKVRGTPQHIAEKYVQLARDAQSSGDPVMAENYLQHAEHYYRIVLAAQEEMTQKYGHQFAPQRPFNEDGDDEGEDGDDDTANGTNNGQQPDLRQGQPYQQNQNGQNQNGNGPQGEGGQRFDRNSGQPRRFDQQDRSPRQDNRQDGRQDGRQDNRGEYRQDRADRPFNGDRQDRNDRDRNDQRPRFDGPRQEGPRQDNPRQENPRQEGPRQDAPRQDGPRQNGEPSHRGDRPRDQDRNRDRFDRQRQDRNAPERSFNDGAPQAHEDSAPPAQLSVEPRNPRRHIPVDDDSDIGGLPAFVTAPKRQVINLEQPPVSDAAPDASASDEFPKRRRGRPRKVDIAAAGGDAE